MGTALKYAEELDFSKPLSEQFGGRFLTKEEADALFESVRTSAYEHVAMNLEHLYTYDLSDVAMTHADLVALLNIARDCRHYAECFSDFAGKIDASAWGLWDDVGKGGESDG